MTPTNTATWHTTAIVHLDRLASAITAAGLRPQARYWVAVPQLCVSHPGMPSLGLIVTAIERTTGNHTPVWLFYLSTGVLTSPCDDIPAAVQDVKNALRPVYAALAPTRSPISPRRHRPT